MLAELLAATGDPPWWVAIGGGTGLAGALGWLLRYTVTTQQERADRLEKVVIDMLPRVTSLMDQSVAALKTAADAIHDATYEDRGRGGRTA